MYIRLLSQNSPSLSLSLSLSLFLPKTYSKDELIILSLPHCVFFALALAPVFASALVIVTVDTVVARDMALFVPSRWALLTTR